MSEEVQTNVTLTGSATRAALAAAVALLICAPSASAAHFQGKRYVPNPSGSREMGTGRAKSTARYVIRRVFAVQLGTEMYICSRHSFSESGCDFQFTSRLGHTACGNARVRAYASRIVVYYDAYTGNCGDF